MLLFFFAAPVTGLAETAEASDRAIFDTTTLYWENDIFSGTDRDYTNGLKLTWSTPFLEDSNASKLPTWAYSLLEHIPFAYDPEADHALSVTLGQNIYTPEDTGRFDLIEDDRPYAGHVYLGTGIHTRSATKKQTWELNLGIIGPASRADDIQKWLHEKTGSDPANGWDNQLENEPTIDIIFETKWKPLHWHATETAAFELITHLGGRIGNVAVYANTGFEVRFGWNLPNNYGVCTIRGGCEMNSAYNGASDHFKNSLQFFSSVEARAVAHDIFLDGNTIADSHNVEKEPLVGDWIVGFAFNIGSFTSSYSYIFQTRQFEGQTNSPDYGAISLSISY
jgi:hypothetical protein